MPKIMRQIFHWPMMGGIGLLIISTTVEMSVAAPVGLALYKKACKKCHGKLGEGKKNKADPSKFKYPPINQLSEENLGKAINKYREMWQRQTFNKTEKKMAKPSGKLSDDRTFLPNKVISVGLPVEEDGLANMTIPLIFNKPMLKGQPTTYVCEDNICQLPTSNFEKIKTFTATAKTYSWYQSELSKTE